MLQQKRDAGKEEEKEEDISRELPHAPSINNLLLEQIQVPRNQSLLPAILSWIEGGNELSQYQMKAVFTRLEWQKKFSQALEVSEWLLKEKPFEPVEHHYARWLYYMGKVHGPDKAEKALSLIPVEFQREVTYCRLFDIYMEYHKVDEAQGIMKRMKDQQIPVSVYICNNLITFYDKNTLQSRIPVLLKEMEEQNIAFSRHTYNVLLACNARNFDMKGMEKVWDHLKADLSVKPDFVSYSTLASAYFFAGLHKKAISALDEAEKHVPEHLTTAKMLMTLISLYGSLRKGEDVGRLYQKLKDMPGQRSIPSYVCTMEAYGEAGFVDCAEEVMKEMELQRGWYHLVQYNALLGVYCKKGLMEKAEEVLKDLLAANHKPDTITYSYLLLGYVRTDQLEKAMRNFENLVMAIRSLAFNWEAFVSREWLLAAHCIIGLLAEKGDAKHAKLLLDELEAAKFHKFPRAYHFIRKAYERSFGCHLLDQWKQVGRT